MQTSPLLHFKFNFPLSFSRDLSNLARRIVREFANFCPPLAPLRAISFVCWPISAFSPVCSTCLLRFSLYERDSSTRKKTVRYVSIRLLAMDAELRRTRWIPTLSFLVYCPGASEKYGNSAIAEKPKTSRIVRAKIPRSIGTFAILFSHCIVSTIFCKRLKQIVNFRMKEVNNLDWIKISKIWKFLNMKALQRK